VRVKLAGIISAKVHGVIRRLLVATAIIAIIFGIGLGWSIRSIVDETPAPNNAASALPPRPAATSTPSALAASQPRLVPTLVPPATAVVTATPASRDVVMEVSEAQLNQRFTSMLVGQSLGQTPLGDARVQSVAVQLQDRQVKLDGNATVGFMRAPFTVTGTVAPTPAGRPLVTVSEATVGGVLLPESARSALAESVQTQVDQMFSDGNVKVRTIDIANGTMRVVGTKGS
jgi:hypothetical protein